MNTRPVGDETDAPAEPRSGEQPANPCPVDEEELWSLAEATRDTNGDAALWRHVDGCSLCQSKVEQFRQLRRKLSTFGRALTPATPKQIGPYRIIRRIGAGGVGVVYEAEQSEPRRRVALKILRGVSVESRRGLRVFQREVQALGRLRHAGIAQIYDVGHTPDGQHFFVMELVDGRPLVEYCNHHGLSVRDRLSLFAAVCKAVHYAHQRGIIHRDLKPANILVDGDGAPRILDFGLARFTDPKANLTRTMSVGQSPVGTLPYMSPEQTRDDPDEIDVRTDVYSLGVMLYELLTGRYPYKVQGPLADVLRTINETEPTALRSIKPQINDELESIVLKALAKNKDHRYPSVEALADDVANYLSGKAITARPPTTAYQLRVFARRNKLTIAAVTAIFGALLSGVIGTTVSYLRAEQARAETASERDNARQVVTFLREMLLSVDPANAAGQEVSVRTILDRGTERVEQGVLADQPEVEAWVRSTLGLTYLKHAFTERGRDHLESALQIRRRLYGNGHVLVAESMNNLARAMRATGGDPVETEALFRGALDILTRHFGKDHPETLETMHQLAGWLADYVDPEAERLYREVAERRRRVLGERHPDLAQTLIELGEWMSWCGDYDACPEQHEAVLAMFQEALDIFRAARGNNHPDVAETLTAIGVTFRHKGDYVGSKEALVEALGIYSSLFRDGYWAIARVETQLGRTLLKTGELEEAETRLCSALQARMGTDRDVITALRRSDLGECLTRLGKLDEARSQLLQAYAFLILGAAGDETMHPITETVVRLRALYDAIGRPAQTEVWLADALPLMREAVENQRHRHGDNDRRTAEFRLNLGVCLTLLGPNHYDEAEHELLRAYDVFHGQFGPDAKSTIQTINQLTALYEAWDRLDDAAAWRARLTDDQLTTRPTIPE